MREERNTADKLEEKKHKHHLHTNKTFLSVAHSQFYQVLSELLASSVSVYYSHAFRTLFVVLFFRECLTTDNAKFVAA